MQPQVLDEHQYTWRSDCWKIERRCSTHGGWCQFTWQPMAMQRQLDNENSILQPTTPGKRLCPMPVTNRPSLQTSVSWTDCSSASAMLAAIFGQKSSTIVEHSPGRHSRLAQKSVAVSDRMTTASPLEKALPQSVFPEHAVGFSGGSDAADYPLRLPGEAVASSRPGGQLLHFMAQRYVREPFWYQSVQQGRLCLQSS